MKPEFIIAVKEFKDYLSSWRFLLIFAVLVLMSIAAIVAGVGTYNSQLSTYNTELSHASSANNGGFQPTMPSMMLVFSSFSTLFVIGGWLLAIGIGFDLISKEKETGSLKLLLARPIFRDSIINGKILGSSAILIVSLLATFLIAFALLLFEGITPSGDDLLRLVTFFVILVLFCLTFLAIAIAASAVARNSTIAILLAIGVVVFGLFLPYFSSSVTSIVLGAAPPVTLTTPSDSSSSSTSGTGGSGAVTYTGIAGATGGNNTRAVRMEVNPAYTSYMQNENQITEAMNLLSPTSDLTSIASVVVDRQRNPSATSGLAGQFYIGGQRGANTEPTLGDTISTVLPQILALLVITIAGFALAYAKFIRMDVR